MRILVVGVGGMGLPVAWALKKLGAELVLQDICKDNLIKAKEVVGDFKESKSFFDIDGFVLDDEPDNIDLVVSCVPYNTNLLVAKFCATFNIRYCDLGGNPDISKEIHALYRVYAKSYDSICFTDLGVAPGLGNILAEHLVKHTENPHTVEIMVGGLPARPTGRLKYNLVFSPKGLWNELTGDCEIIRDGKKQIVPALEEITALSETFEVSHTKGGLSASVDLMLERGVQNLSYKTIRIKGHYDYINFLLKDCGLENACETFEEMIGNACPATKKDQILLRVNVDDHYVEAIIDSDEWTAMQKATAFSAAAVAAIMASGKLDGPNCVLDYSSIPLEEFKENLKLIGGMPVDNLFEIKKESERTEEIFKDYVLNL